LLPRTIQLCVHCQQRPAGFWVRRTGGMVVRRPWCMSCSQDLDRDDYDVIPFGQLMARGNHGAALREPSPYRVAVPKSARRKMNKTLAVVMTALVVNP